MNERMYRDYHDAWDAGSKRAPTIEHITFNWYDDNGVLRNTTTISRDEIQSAEITTNVTADGTASIGSLATTTATISVLTSAYNRAIKIKDASTFRASLTVYAEYPFTAVGSSEQTVLTRRYTLILDPSATEKHGLFTTIIAYDGLSQVWLDDKIPESLAWSNSMTIRENIQNIFRSATNPVFANRKYALIDFNSIIIQGDTSMTDLSSLIDRPSTVSESSIVTYRNALSVAALSMYGCLVYHGDTANVYLKRLEASHDDMALQPQFRAVDTVTTDMVRYGGLSVSAGYTGWDSAIATLDDNTTAKMWSIYASSTGDIPEHATGRIVIPKGYFANALRFYGWTSPTTNLAKLRNLVALRGFSADLVDARPWLDPYDVIHITDDEGTTHTACITNVTWRFGTTPAMTIGCQSNTYSMADDSDSQTGYSVDQIGVDAGLSLSSRVSDLEQRTDTIDQWRANTPTLGALAGKDSLVAADIPNLAASKITSGTFGTARIPKTRTSFSVTADTTHTITLYNQANRYQASTEIVQLAFHFTIVATSNIAAGTLFKVGTIPAEYAPSQVTALAITIYSGTATATWSAHINSSGEIYVRRSTQLASGASVSYIKVHGMWFT